MPSIESLSPRDQGMIADALEELGNQWGREEYIHHYLTGEARSIRNRLERAR